MIAGERGVFADAVKLRAMLYGELRVLPRDATVRGPRELVASSELQREAVGLPLIQLVIGHEIMVPWGNGRPSHRR